MDDVKFVINYDFPLNTEDYVHRIGRTGRSNNKGTSYTFFTDNHAARADELINILQESNQVHCVIYEYARDFSNNIFNFHSMSVLNSFDSREVHEALRISSKDHLEKASPKDQEIQAMVAVTSDATVTSKTTIDMDIERPGAEIEAWTTTISCT